MKNLISLLFLFLSFTYSKAQDSASSSSITDLIVPQTSRAIYKGKLLTGIDYGYSNNRLTTNSQELNFWSNGPSLNLGYGITKRLDIRISTGYSSTTYRHYDHGQGFSGKNHSWNGFSIGSKLNLLKQKGWIPELAVNASVSFGNFSNKLTYLGTDIGLPWAYKLGKKFRLGGSFNFYHTNSVTDLGTLWDSFYYSINATYEFMDALGVYAQLALPKNLQSYYTIPKVGAYYRINPKMQVNLNFSKTFASSNTQNIYEGQYVSAGFSWLMLK